MAQRVLVTGAAGRLGREVCKAIVDAGHELRATDRVYQRDLPFRLEVAELLDPPAAYRLAEGCDAVIHLANHPNAHGRIPPPQLYSENVTLNANVFQAAVDLGAGCIVFASSIQAMSGNRSLDHDEPATEQPSCLAYLPIDGSAPACPRNAYAASKEAGELLLKYHAAMQADLCAAAIRYPFLVSDRWLKWIRRHRRERRRRGHWGMPDEGFSYLDMRDAASLAVALVEKRPPGYHQFLPAAPEAYLDLPVAEMLEKFYPGVPLKQPADQIRSLVDISGITELVGWEPQHTGLFAADDHEEDEDA